MTERKSIDAFETRLTTLFRMYTEPAARPSDPLETARAAMASTIGGGVLGRLLPIGRNRRLTWMLLVAALVVASAALAVAVGSRPSLVQGPDGPPRIVFVRDGDLFIADIDGSRQILIASGSSDGGKLGYLTAAWSPDMTHIAAVRDVGGAFLTPAVDVMTDVGAVVRSVALSAGCGPSVSWSPDSSEVAIATCPADVPRDPFRSIPSGIRVLIAGLDASSDREIALPSDWTSVASAYRAVWIRPDLWARWSPDGRWIAVWAIVAGQAGRYLVAADGSGTQRVEALAEGLHRVDSFDWAPDGRGLAISGNLVGCVAAVCLGIVDPDAGLVTSTVAHPYAEEPKLHGKLFWPELSPAGDRVAVLGGLIDFTSEPKVTETHTLYIYDLATARFIELTYGIRPMALDLTGAAYPSGGDTGELVAEGSVAWTPDGRALLYLVFSGGDGVLTWTLRSVDATGGSPSSVVIDDVQSFDIGPRH